MTLGVSNVSRIHFGFKFIVNPDPDPIIEYALTAKYTISMAQVHFIHMAGWRQSKHLQSTDAFITAIATASRWAV